LVNLVDAAMDERIGDCLWKESLHTALCGLFAHSVTVGFIDLRRKHDPPQPTTVITADLEQSAPFIRVGKVIPGALGKFSIERKRRRKNEEAFWMRIALECDVQRFSHK